MTSVLIVGSGAREHALAWKLGQSPCVDRVLVAPGNAGTEAIAENISLAADDVLGLVELVRRRDIRLTVIGPEAPLALGLADALRADWMIQCTGRLVVGPGAAAARLESSKSFAKELMLAAGVPTARFRVFDRASEAIAWLHESAYPVVVKADGLAAGKGVVVCQDEAEARATIEAFMLRGIHGPAGHRLVIEEVLHGPEVSLLALVDGERLVPLPVAQDHKRLGDGDQGPNTGGMGAYAPYPGITPLEADELAQQLILPVVQLLRDRGIPYRGILFAGLMLTPDGPKVLEYNCRFGDPETQVILPLLAGDLFPWLEMVATGSLEGRPAIVPGSAVGIVLAAAGYPERSMIGEPIDGLDIVSPDVHIFHAGTARDGAGRTVTAGGRVLTVVGTGPTLETAGANAYRIPVHFAGMQYRRDIGHQALPSPVVDATSRPRICVLAAGHGSNLHALVEACASGELAADIVAVASHRADAGALRLAAAAGIPTVALPFPSGAGPEQRRQYEDRLLRAIAPSRPDLLILAGWMLILSADFLESCGCPVINVHPALLEPEQFNLTTHRVPEMAGVSSRATAPERESVGSLTPPFPVLRGTHAVRDALALDLPMTGVSVHFVTPEVDAGPVILAETVPIEPGDSETTLHARIKVVEHRLLPRAAHQILYPAPSGGTSA